MHIKQIVDQTRRDFTADYECEHCGHVVRRSGYDDANFHNNVIPHMECPVCSRRAGPSYSPRGTKYAEGVSV